MSTPRSRTDRNAFRAGLLLALGYVAFAFVLLARGFPHEDAFILFKYAKNLACGDGIVFFAGGPHAEGATDFLWMMLLAGARAIGLDVAAAAALLNGLGFFLVAWIFLVARPNRTTYVRGVAVALLFASSAAVAGARGFSAMLYSAVALFTLTRVVAPSSRASNDLPWLALLLGLIRPDGVVLGAGLGVIAAFRAYKNRHFRDFAFRVVAALIAGAIYFVWRWHYFGSLLPLPLYVKQHYNVGWPPGVEVTLDWCAATLLPLATVMVLSRIVLGPLRARDALRLRALGIGLVPFAIHVASFVPSYPTQNAVDRFEAPAQLALLFFTLQLLTARRRKQVVLPRIAFLSATLIVAFFPMFRLDWLEIRDSLWGQYPDALSRDLGALTDSNTKIAATEAGRVLYFARGPVLDLVGLNTRETALDPPSRKLLNNFDPDVVMIHHAGTLREESIIDTGGDVVPIHEPLWTHIKPNILFLLQGNLPPYAVLKVPNVFVAAAATEGFLDSASDRYDVYAVRFESRRFHFHIYAVKKNWPRKQALLDAIVKAHRESSAHSYLEYSPLFTRQCEE